MGCWEWIWAQKHTQRNAVVRTYQLGYAAFEEIVRDHKPVLCSQCRAVRVAATAGTRVGSRVMSLQGSRLTLRPVSKVSGQRSWWQDDGDVPHSCSL